MFTSFGVPPGRGLVPGQQSMSQRKQVALKKKGGIPPIQTSTTFSKKKLNKAQNNIPKPSKAKKAMQ
jgi:hypothetical protein